VGLGVLGGELVVLIAIGVAVTMGVGSATGATTTTGVTTGPGSDFICVEVGGSCVIVLASVA
jgi:hypothetical protein